MADLARKEFAALLMEIESAWHSEGRRMASRAAWLKSESADHFEKMSPVALERMHSDGQSNSNINNSNSNSNNSSRNTSQDDQDDGDVDDALSSLSMSV